MLLCVPDGGTSTSPPLCNQLTHRRHELDRHVHRSVRRRLVGSFIFRYRFFIGLRRVMLQNTAHALFVPSQWDISLASLSSPPPTPKRPQCLGPKLVRADYEDGVPRRVRYVDHAQVPSGPRSTQCDSRFLSWSILHGSTNHVFDFRLCYTVAIDVWLLRLRIDAVTNLHDGMLSPSAV